MDKPPIKILHLISTLDMGGAEQNLLRLVTSMNRVVFENHVVSMTKPGIIGGKLEQAGVPVHGLSMKKGLPDIRAVLRLRFLAAIIKPAVIQCWMYHANLLGLTLSSSDKTLWNIRCSDMDLSLYGRIYRYTVQAGAKLSPLPSAVIANSHAGADVHRKLGYHPKKWIIIPNGFDTDHFKPDASAGSQIRAELKIPGGTLVIGLICRFDPMKDHATFFQAAEAFLNHHPDTCFILAGRGVSRNNPSIEHLLPAGSKKAAFHLLDERNDIEKIFASLDIATSSSAWGEGFPNAIGEAMSCGVPCVATNAGDAGILVDDTGIVVNRQSPRELCEGWNKIAGMSPGDRRAMGRSARQRIMDHYSQDKTTQQYETLYQETIRSQTARKTAGQS
jgi:glycosyltransferase involved in cell wall biosynthesis